MPFGKKIKPLRGHSKPEAPYIMSGDSKITNKKEQTRILAETWENTFRTTPNNNSNWANINKITTWINNNRSTTAPYKKINLSRLNEDNELTSPITIDELENFIKIMKKKAPC